MMSRCAPAWCRPTAAANISGIYCKCYNARSPCSGRRLPIHSDSPRQLRIYRASSEAPLGGLMPSQIMRHLCEPDNTLALWKGEIA